jgi:hypothetical protein
MSDEDGLVPHNSLFSQLSTLNWPVTNPAGRFRSRKAAATCGPFHSHRLYCYRRSRLTP